LKIVFMGTPQFAVPVLEALVKAGHEIPFVVTQPDRPKGRSKKPVPPPVKALAESLSLPVFQPERVRRPEAIEEIRKSSPDALVVAAFGQILPKALLEIPRLGNFNVHASLLPKYRGAAPINWAIINGEADTGVTIMLMDEGMDTGAMLATAVEPILPEDTADTLTAKLSRVGAELIVKALAEFEAGLLKPVSQDNYQATYAPILKKEMGRIDWAKPAVEIERTVRGLDPWPGAYTSLSGKMLHIWRAAVAPVDNLSPAGMVVSAGKDGIVVATGEGALVIEELQPEGGRRMKTSEYLAGHKIAPGEILG
jgi:methionyl-tRNA formyltransferase